MKKINKPIIIVLLIYFVWILFLLKDVIETEEANKESNKKEGFKYHRYLTTKEVIEKVGLWNFIKSRYVPIRHYLKTALSKDGRCCGFNWNLFDTRFILRKAIEGYDFR